MGDIEKSSSSMHDCPYVEGLSCNQKPFVCDKARFEVHCLKAILHQISLQNKANHNLLRKDGMEQAVLWLFDNDYIREEFYKNSVNDLVKLITKDLNMVLKVPTREIRVEVVK